jgi:hypothetical protein
MNQLREKAQALLAPTLASCRGGSTDVDRNLATIGEAGALVSGLALSRGGAVEANPIQCTDGRSVTYALAEAAEGPVSALLARKPTPNVEASRPAKDE